MVEFIVVGVSAFVAGAVVVQVYQGKTVAAAVADLKTIFAAEVAKAKVDVANLKTDVAAVVAKVKAAV